ncbi:MAG: SWIM zinc finger family protein, partial [Bdellovibrionaceae bacterium]|nr:SWIM zinc finger family protein [Pseudobdellovibrionaceae bacterium]
ETWEHFFKPEVRNSGRALAAKELVRLGRASDTELVSYVRSTSNIKVTFKSDSIDSSSISVTCTCPLGQKGQFCKHMWAVLSTIVEKNPDFLFNKTELSTPSGTTIASKEKPKISQAHADKQEAYKLKQADYRKQQYQLQKQRLQSLKKSSKTKVPTKAEFPEAVEAALHYFTENGFPLQNSMDEESISTARKKLARIFHPDRGGSHDEIVELNQHTDVLIKFSDI